MSAHDQDPIEHVGCLDAPPSWCPLRSDGATARGVVLTAEQVRALLEEGLECRADVERRIDLMQRPADWKERAR